MREEKFTFAGVVGVKKLIEQIDYFVSAIALLLWWIIFGGEE